MSGGLSVAGGAGGITASLEALDAMGEGLVRLSRRGRDIADELVGVANSACVVAGMLLCPVAGALAEIALVRAAAQVLSISMRLFRLGECVRLAVALYQQADATAAAAFRTGQDVVAFGVGVRLGCGWTAIAVGVGMEGTGVAVADAASSAGFEAGPGAVVLRRAAKRAGGLGVDAVGDGLARNPWLMSGVAGGAEGLVAGVAATGLVGSPLGLATLGLVGPGALSGSREAMLGSLLRTAPMIGVLDDGLRGRAVRLPASNDSPAAVTPARSAASPARSAVPPTSIADVAASMDQVGAMATRPRQAQTDPWRSRVRVTRVDQPDGGRAWVVVIPGTQTWDVRAGTNPSDLTSNLSIMSGADGALVEAARDAMTQAGIAPGEPVLVAGHSQGGLAAAALASDPDSPFTITHVYTEGSPIADIDIAEGVDVLAVEHAADLVAHLDDGPGVNPDRTNWTTVTAPMPTADQVAVPDEATRWAPLLAHDSIKYQWTAGALDESSNPSIVGWRDGAAVFFRGDGEVTEYRMERVP